MSNETDLDWLARNVHEWCQLHDAVAIVRHTDATFHEPNKGFTTAINRDQWLARRAELQNKPGWHEWPQGKFMAQNEKGCWIVSDRDLFPGDDGRWHYDKDQDGGVTSRGCGEVLGDWRDTLERRPESPEKFQPITSIEDNQEQDMAKQSTTQQAEKQQDNSWFERGELPPVGTVCQFFSAGYDGDWFDWCIFHGLSTLGGFIVEYHHRSSPEMVTVTLFDPALTNFRPIRTERELLIDAIASQGFLSKSGDVCGQIADAVIAAGFKLGVP